MYIAEDRKNGSLAMQSHSRFIIADITSVHQSESSVLKFINGTYDIAGKNSVEHHQQN